MDQNFYTGSNGSDGLGGLGTAALVSGNGLGNGPWGAGFGGFLGSILGNGLGGFGGFGGNNAIPLMMMMNGGFGGGNAAVQGQIQNLSNQISDNANSAATNQAIGAVSSSVKDNGIALNAGLDAVNAGLCGVKTAILEQGAAINLNNCQQSNLILQQAQALANTIQNGFTQIGFQIERNACDVKEAATANTQRVVDTLANHWSQEQLATITQLRDELATINQTNALIAALGGTATATTKSSATS